MNPVKKISAAPPAQIFRLIREQPGTWLLYLLGYSLLSALPQEFAYRLFFFDRYKAIFNKESDLILASSVTFGFAHVIFHNYLALALTFIAGWLIASSYARYRSLTFVWFEHAVYGSLAFSIGLDHFFQ